MSLELETRLANLERDNRRWRLAAGAACAVAGVAAFLAGNRQAEGIAPPGALVGSSLTIVNASGKVVADINPAAEGGQCRLFDNAGKARVAFGTNREGAGVLVLGETGGKSVVRASITISEKSGPAVQLFSDSGAAVATLRAAGKDGHLVLLNEKGKGVVLPRSAERAEADGKDG